MNLGCGCGIIEPSDDGLASARGLMRDAKQMEKEMEALERRIALYKEKARRYFGGGMECDACEGGGGFDTPGDWDGPMGVSGWETCVECDGYGVTDALTCADHADYANRCKVCHTSLADDEKMRGTCDEHKDK